MPNDSPGDASVAFRPARALAQVSVAWCVALVTTIACPPAGAQAPAGTAGIPPITSMGQPPRWQSYTSGVATFGRKDDAVGGLVVGLFHPRGSPITGMFGLSSEAYVYARDGGGATGGARLLGVTSAANLGYGIDWDARENNFAFMLSVNTAVRRGGIFGRGTTLRIDWIPPRGNSIDVGITVPLFQRYAGRTRPQNTGASLREAARAASTERTRSINPRETVSRAAGTLLPASADTALGLVREAALLIAAYNNFFSEYHDTDRERDAKKIRATAQRARETMTRVTLDYPHGHTSKETERVYAASLRHAFSIAAGGDTTLGGVVTRRARVGLLNQFLIPYNALFGRVKERERGALLSPLRDATRADLQAWMADSSGLSRESQLAVVRVHEAWLASVVAVHDRLADQWSDSRRVWLPLQLALAEDEHDDQAEIDALIGRVVGHPFSRGNQITYLHEDRVQIELARTILAARDYHVLWVHDYAGQRPSGRVDRLGFAQTANVYYPALTRAVARYDSTGSLTTFLVFLDQVFYEGDNGRLWMTILEDPLGATIELPGQERLAGDDPPGTTAAVAGCGRAVAWAAGPRGPPRRE